MSVSCPSSTRFLLYIRSTSSRNPKHFRLQPWKNSFCRMMMHSRPQTPLPNVLKEISCRMLLSCQIRPACQSPPVPIFGVNICPFIYGIKDDFIPELTINAQCLQAESAQHSFFPPSNRWSFRPDPNPNSLTFQASTFKWRTKTHLFR
jgi:hypothetical protein